MGADGRRLQPRRARWPATTTRWRTTAREALRPSTTMRSPTSWRRAPASCRSAIRPACSTDQGSVPPHGLAGPAYKPYLSLSGTSMAAPVVAGTVALMIQANPKLTPNLVKAILQYTAQGYDYNALTAGRRLPEYSRRGRPGAILPDAPGRPGYPYTRGGEARLSGATSVLTGGVIKPDRRTRVGRRDIVWGSADAQRREHRLGHGLRPTTRDNIVVGQHRLGPPDARQHRVGHGRRDGDNIVWGTLRGRRQHRVGHGRATSTTSSGARCATATTSCGARRCDADNIVWGTLCSGNDNMVWGSSLRDDNIVWGTALDRENIVWGTCGDGDNIVWGTSDETEKPTALTTIRTRVRRTTRC